MGGKNTETCGRCSMTTVVGATQEDEEDAAEHDPFAGERIEVDESEMRTVARPAVWLAKAKRRLDTLATRLTYGR